MRRIVSAFFAVFLLLVSDGASAQTGFTEESCAVPEMRTDRRPDANDVPTLVTIGLQLVDLVKIDDIEQQMTIDLVTLQSWRDSRLQGLEGCILPLGAVWSPHLDFINSGRVFPGMPEAVRVEENGRIVYVQRYRGTISFPHVLDRFPFDRQTLRISLTTLAGEQSEIKLLADTDFTGRAEQLLVPDWIVGDGSGTVREQLMVAVNQVHSRFDFEVEVERRAAYYVWKVIIPLILIVAMSWSVFWINPAQFGPQIGMSATSMLTLIAFQFAMGGILPRLSYFTTLDWFIAGSTILVFVALLESLTTTYLVSKEKKEIAVRLDKICRWLFPLAFAVLNLVVFFPRT